MDVVAKRKTLFDGMPVEISELTYVIKPRPCIVESTNCRIASAYSIATSEDWSLEGRPRGRT